MIDVQNQLLELIRAKTGVTPKLEDTLDAMKIDSLAMAELTVDIERAFDIRIDEEVLDVEDFQGLVKYVERKVAKLPQDAP